MHVWQSMFSFVVVLRSAMFDTVQSTDTRRHSAVPELDLSIGGTVCVSVTSLQAYHVKARDHGVCTTRQTKDSRFLRPTFLPWVPGEHLVGLQTRRQQVKTAKTRTILTNKPSQAYLGMIEDRHIIQYLVQKTSKKLHPCLRLVPILMTLNDQLLLWLAAQKLIHTTPDKAILSPTKTQPRICRFQQCTDRA